MIVTGKSIRMQNQITPSPKFFFIKRIKKKWIVVTIVNSNQIVRYTNKSLDKLGEREDT